MKNGIERRIFFSEQIGTEFGTEEYQKLMRDMHEATCDAAGVARHTYEADFAEKRLKELRNSKSR